MLDSGKDELKRGFFCFDREEAIFLDTRTAWVDLLEESARNLIHSIIHQWIDNIVGAASWDDLWTTEVLDTSKTTFLKR